MARAAESAATSATTAALADAARALPLLDSVARLAMSGHRAVISRSNPAAAVAPMACPRKALHQPSMTRA